MVLVNPLNEYGMPFTEFDLVDQEASIADFHLYLLYDYTIVCGKSITRG